MVCSLLHFGQQLLAVHCPDVTFHYFGAMKIGRSNYLNYINLVHRQTLRLKNGRMLYQASCVV